MKPTGGRRKKPFNRKWQHLRLVGQGNKVNSLMEATKSGLWIKKFLGAEKEAEEETERWILHEGKGIITVAWR